jgi:hypothetical protein
MMPMALSLASSFTRKHSAAVSLTIALTILSIISSLILVLKTGTNLLLQADLSRETVYPGLSKEVFLSKLHYVLSRVLDKELLLFDVSIYTLKDALNRREHKGLLV